MAVTNGLSQATVQHDWTAVNLSVCMIIISDDPLLTHIKTDVLQTNSFDCGLWVLACIAANLRGYNVTGLEEADMVWFRQWITRLVMSIPAVVK